MLIELLPHFLIIGLISLIDFATILRARFIDPFEVTPSTPRNEDFTLLIPIFGDISYLKNVAFLRRYREHVVLCTTTKESKTFDTAIERVAEENGFRIFRSDAVLASQDKPNPWRLFRGTLHGRKNIAALDGEVEVKINKEIARDEIIRDSFESVQTKYCIFLDGDTTATDDLAQLVGAVDENDLDIASVRVLASRRKTLIEKLQAVEYELAMDARRVYPWLTSGACMAAKTSVIKDIMSHHSLFFSGGDIEIGKLAKMLKYNVGHIAFRFYTVVPSTFRSWFKQRMAWFGGGFRHAIVNLHQYTWRHPLFYFYTTFLVYLLCPLRWYEIIAHPEIVLIVVALYWGMIFFFHFRRVRWFYILFPFYALLQVMVLVPCGVYTYFKMATSANNAGFIKLRQKRRRTLSQVFDVSIYALKKTR